MSKIKYILVLFLLTGFAQADPLRDCENISTIPSNASLSERQAVTQTCHLHNIENHNAVQRQFLKQIEKNTSSMMVMFPSDLDDFDNASIFESGHNADPLDNSLCTINPGNGRRIIIQSSTWLSMTVVQKEANISRLFESQAQTPSVRICIHLPAPPPPPPPAPTGQSEYMSAVNNCHICHGDRGQGTAIFYDFDINPTGGDGCSLVDCSDRSELITYIETEMPAGAANRCGLACATAIADFMLNDFQ